MPIASKTGEVFYNRKGDAGESGKPGPLVYPAGEFRINEIYTMTELSTPVVLCDGEYYVLNILGTTVGINPKDDYAANGSKARWLLMTKMKYAFVEVLMANFAKFASAVFWGDFQFSQQGVDANGNATSDYRKFGTDDFSPNMLLDFHLGKFKCNEVEVEGVIKGGYQSKCTAIDMYNMNELLEIDLSKGTDYIFYVNKGGGVDAYASLPTDKKYIGVSVRISLFAIQSYATITFRRAVYRLRIDSSDKVMISLNSFVVFHGVSSVSASGIGETCEWRIVNSGDFQKVTNAEGQISFKSLI
ncbi:hypothetical protein [Bacteroides sp.]|uniref:hypothetical protein n=1 Tax=Bacteroides sp. TaxID=29523 RepID=UPI002614DF48|nr:hypothetical protein [Bacteroides sp.]MDD3038808.1 hypothetical protein [Bacteroides sp.]